MKRGTPKRPKALLSTFGTLGDLNPFLVLGQKLRDRGFEITLASSAYHRSFVEVEGFSFIEVPPDIDPKNDELIRLGLDPKRGTEHILRKLVLPSLEEGYRILLQAAKDHDLLISHPLSFAASLIHEKMGIPWVSTQMSPYGILSEYDLPVVGLFPGAEWLSGQGAWLGRPLIRSAKNWVAGWGKPIQSLRVKEGLEPTEHPLLSGMKSPILNLALFSKVIGAPQSDWPLQTLQTGFLWKNTIGTSAELQRFYDFVESSNLSPDIYSLGSGAVIRPGKFFEIAVEATLRSGRRAALLAGSFAPELKQKWEGTGKIFVTESLPHERIFSLGRVLVISPGMGTLARGLQAGKPMVLIPVANDQFDNASRMRRQGLAESLALKSFTVERLIRSLYLSETNPRPDVRSILSDEESELMKALDRIENLV